jgi:hypothetical protein
MKMRTWLSLVSALCALEAYAADPTPKHELIPTQDAGQPGSLCPLPPEVQDGYKLDPEFFEAHPFRGCLHVFADGVQGDRYTPYPFQIYSGEKNIFTGTADLAYVKKLMKGSGYRPLQVAGQNRAYAYVYLNHLVASCGAYNEMFTFYAAVKDEDVKKDEQKSDADPTKIKATFISPKDADGRDNPISPVAALSAPGAVFFFHMAMLDKPIAIDYGRSLMGFDKKFGKIELNEPGAQRRFSATDADGKLIVESDVSENLADVQSAVVNGLIPALAANGLSLPVPDPAKKPMNLWPLVSRLPGGPMVTTYFFNRIQPMLRKLTATDTFKLGDSPATRELRDMRFAPTAITWAPVVGALESPQWYDAK